MKYITYTMLLIQTGLIYQKIMASYTMTWAETFTPLYVLGGFAIFYYLVTAIVQEMRDNEHPNDYKF